MSWRISSDRADMQLGVIHGFLTGSYWSRGIPAETVARAIAGSYCVGAFAPDGSQAAFARVISDHATFAYLADVFVVPAARGQWLATRLLAHIDAEPSLAGLRRWLLATRDAHGLYARFGWRPLAEPGLLMERVDPDIYQRGVGT